MTTRAGFAVSTALTLLGVGCAFRTPAVHVPEAMPPVTAGALDVSVTVVGAYDIARVRRHTTELLARAAASDRREGGGPAIVHVRVAIEPHPSMSLERAYLPLVLWMLPFGFVTTHERVAIDVIVQAGEHRFTGRGTADVWGSLYSPPLRRALAVALDRALASAAPRSGASTGAGVGFGP